MRLLATACRVVQNQVETLMLEQTSSLQLVEIRQESWVPPHTDRAVLSEDPSSWNVVGPDLCLSVIQFNFSSFSLHPNLKCCVSLDRNR